MYMSANSMKCNDSSSNFHSHFEFPSPFWGLEISPLFLSTRKYIKFVIIVRCYKTYHRLGSLNTDIYFS